MFYSVCAYVVSLLHNTMVCLQKKIVTSN